MTLEKILADYDYQLPERLIAKRPARPRDSAKLLVYSRKNQNVTIDTFYNIDRYLPQKSVLVLNDTKVIPARFMLKKQTGGSVEAFYIRNDYDKIVVLLNKKVLVNTNLFLTSHTYFTVISTQGKYFFLKPSFPVSELFPVLNRHGSMPIPKYIKGEFNQEKLKRDYQSVFAQKNGSVAAPTASLHFTNRLLQKLEHKGIKKEFVTLHVNEGTFAPLSEKHLTTKTLHEEYFEIDNKTIKRLNLAKKNHMSIIAVGTTVVRALESSKHDELLSTSSGKTTIFIQETDKHHYVDGLITNFHLPHSSLMMLVASFIGRKKLLDLYNIAINNHLRFYSFGDAMLIL